MLVSRVMSRVLPALLIFLAGCHTCPVAPTPMQRRLKQTKKRPQDMTDRVLPDDKLPEWLKRNYAEWIRYAYDLEEPPR